MQRASNITFIGEAGVGKSGLATGLLLKAMANGYRGFFISAQDLFDEIYTSLADRSTRRLLNRLMRVDVLVIDEMGYLNLKPEQSNAFFKLMHERYAKRSTIITTNLDYPQWYDFLGNKKMVKALLDRLRHRCHTIRIKGDLSANHKAKYRSVQPRTPSPSMQRHQADRAHNRTPADGQILTSPAGSILMSAEA